MSPHDNRIGDVGTASKTITTEAIEAFADISGDENPLHLNDVYADETMFNGRIAHGTLVEGVVSAALAALDGVVVYLGKELSFKAPVRPGDTVTANATITAESSDNVYTVEVAATVDDDTVVIDGTATVQINEEPDTDPSTTPTENDSKSAVLYFDGACRGNPGAAATGYVLETMQNVLHDGRSLGEQTNNEAEYKALLDGLREAKAHGVTDIDIHGDSQVIIRQVTGDYDCNASNLAPLLDDVHEALDGFDSWTITHVPREENEGADTAANDALCD